MKKILILMMILMMTSCTVLKPVVVRDSTVVSYNYIDSVRFVDSTVYHHLYKEVYNDYTGLLDTLNLEDTYSKAKAYIDTTNKLLKGSIATKDVDIPVKIKWKEKIVYRDSVVHQKEEVPVPYEVVKTKHPKYEWILWTWLVLSVLGIAAFIYKKFFIK